MVLGLTRAAVNRPEPQPPPPKLRLNEGPARLPWSKVSVETRVKLASSVKSVGRAA